MDISALPIGALDTPIKSPHEIKEDEVSLDHYLSSIIHGLNYYYYNFIYRF